MHQPLYPVDAVGTSSETQSAPSLTLTREEMLRDLSALGTLCQDFRTLIETCWDDDHRADTTRELLANHRELATADAGPFRVLGPARGLLHAITARLSSDTVTFRVRGGSGQTARPGAETAGIEAMSAHMRTLIPPLEALASRVYGLARSGGAAEHLRVHRMLGPTVALLKAVVRQDWSDAGLVLNHLNMMTTSRESEALGEQIGRLLRSVYNSLNEISRTVPVEALSDVTDEIPDAVERLNSVITELEAGANRNLDLLEALSARVNEDRTLAETATQVLGECDAALAELAAAQPEAQADLAALRSELTTDAVAPIARYQARLQTSHDLYMTLFANQSYQDLTGQTLKKVIAFIESLQYQLIQVISKASGKATLTAAPEPRGPALEAGPDARNRLSQDKVDSMLAEMGF